MASYGGKTEWDDQMIRLGHQQAPEPTVTEEQLVEMLEKAAKEYTKEPSKEEKLEKATLDELDELEDDEDDEILEKYRRQRMEEMRAQAVRNRYGTIGEIKGNTWKLEVTDAPKDVFVVIHLYQSGIPACQIVNNCLVELAHRFKDVKFLRAVANETIPNYPDKNCPTILVYKNGDVQCQMIGLKQMGGTETDLKPDELEYQLAHLSGAIKTDLERNPRQDREFKLTRPGKSKWKRDSDSEEDFE